LTPASLKSRLIGAVKATDDTARLFFVYAVFRISKTKQQPTPKPEPETVVSAKTFH